MSSVSGREARSKWARSCEKSAAVQASRSRACRDPEQRTRHRIALAGVDGGGETEEAASERMDWR